MSDSHEYRDAYKHAQRELADLVSQKDRIETRIIVVRQSLETLAALCESEEIPIERSAEAAYLLDNSTIADEIRAILTGAYPEWFRPTELKLRLENIGHDFSAHTNPLAMIHMVLKRMATSEEIEESKDSDEKTVYRRKPTAQKVKDALTLAEARWKDKPLAERIAVATRPRRLTRLDAAIEADKLPPAVKQAIYGPRKAIEQIIENRKAAKKGRYGGPPVSDET